MRGQSVSCGGEQRRRTTYMIDELARQINISRATWDYNAHGTRECTTGCERKEILIWSQAAIKGGSTVQREQAVALSNLICQDRIDDYNVWTVDSVERLQRISGATFVPRNLHPDTCCLSEMLRHLLQRGHLSFGTSMPQLQELGQRGGIARPRCDGEAKGDASH